MTVSSLLSDEVFSTFSPDLKVGPTSMEVSMRTFRKLVTALLVPMVSLSSPAFAQEQHAVSPAALAATVTQHIADEQASRAAVRDALNRPEVRETAAKAGVDLQRIASVAETLTGLDLQRASAAAQQVNQALSGGASTITITTTTLIIVLLLVLLIIVAVD